MAAVYLLIGDFIFLHMPIISGCPAWAISTFSNLAWRTRVSELHVNEWELHMLRYISYEMFTFPVQRYIGDNNVILDDDPSYDNTISSHDELGSLHMGNVLGIYFCNWLI